MIVRGSASKKGGFCVLLCALLIVGCQCRKSDGFSYQTIYLLPDGRVEFSGNVGAMDSMLPKLPSPSTTRIIIAACTTEKTEETVRVVRSLQAAGYRDIGLIGVGPDRKSTCAR